MTIAMPFRRAVTLAAPFVRNDLWRRARAVPSLDLRFADNKSLTDAVTGASLITFTRASSGTFVDSAGVLQTAVTDVPRFDHNPITGESLGLLVEEQRVNSIRNNTMVGAVAGTPGTLPTNWAATTPANGITREILGTGTEDGIAYIDFRFSGTNTLGSTYYMDITFDSGAIVAAQGQSWTESIYAKLIAGSITGAAFNSVPGIVLYSTPNFDDNGSLRPVSATNARLSSQRFSATRTLANATSTGVSPRFSWTIATGGTIDFTLRIGLPQLEQGAFATSPILTSGAAATRNADVPSITGSAFSGWYRQDEGTVFAENTQAVTTGDIAYAYYIDAGSGLANSIYSDATNGNRRGVVFVGNSVQCATNFGAISANAFVRTAFGLRQDLFGLVANGGTVNQDTLGSMPTSLTRMFIGNNSASSAAVNGTIRRLAFWGQRLPNNVLQQITQ